MKDAYMGLKLVVFVVVWLGRIVQGFAAKRGPKKKASPNPYPENRNLKLKTMVQEVEGPQLTPEEAEAFIAEQEGINNEVGVMIVFNRHVAFY
eukprot:1393864-Amorphochlora_amoeboformis.AAC.1